MNDQQLQQAVEANKISVEAQQLLDDCIANLTSITEKKDYCIGLHISASFIKHSSISGELLSVLAKAFKMEIATQKERIKNL